ncbi:hypothetical protein FB451DRAFT_1431702 [Mycena latifolia]|nr:hypothetical protein FB451DRAFT_1431702 [Mycena latifolia]
MPRNLAHHRPPRRLARAFPICACTVACAGSVLVAFSGSSYSSPRIVVLSLHLRPSPRGSNVLQSPPTVVSVAFSGHVTSANQVPILPSTPDPRSTSSSVAPLALNSIVEEPRLISQHLGTSNGGQCSLFTLQPNWTHSPHSNGNLSLPTTKTTAKSVADEDASIRATVRCSSHSISDAIYFIGK